MLMEFLRDLAMGAIADEVRKTPQGQKLQEEYAKPVAETVVDAVAPVTRPAINSGTQLDAYGYPTTSPMLEAQTAPYNRKGMEPISPYALQDMARMAYSEQQGRQNELDHLVANENMQNVQDYLRNAGGSDIDPAKVDQLRKENPELAKKVIDEGLGEKAKTTVDILSNAQDQEDSWFGGFGDRVSGFFGNKENFLAMALAFNSLRYEPDQGLAAVLGKRLEAASATKKANATANWLRSKGTPNAIKAAEYLEAGGAVKDALKIYSGGTDSDWGLQPISIQDEQGNVKLLQLSKDGTTRELPMPKGYKPSPNVQKVDVGTGTALVDKNGNLIRVIEKDISGAEAQKVAGKYTQEQINAAPQNYENSKNQLSVVNKLLDHKGFDSLFGAIQGRLPSVRQDTLDAESILNQIKGTAFLAAFSSLKGGGQISNVEGMKAEQAIARLQTTQSEKAAREALNELASILRSGMAKAQAMAPEKIGATQTPVQSEQQPAAKPQITPEQAAAELARRRGQ